jgi:hypothetical protein
MNFTMVWIVAIVLAAGAVYGKGQLDASRRAEISKIVAAKEALEAEVRRQQRLQVAAAEDALQARKVQAQKEGEVNDLREELAKRKPVAACQWTPSQRSRLRKITVGKPGTTPRAGQ